MVFTASHIPASTHIDIIILSPPIADFIHILFQPQHLRVPLPESTSQPTRC
ncbi:hypothetical protein GCK32_021796, partial [Trichostrongylus colubriformis]